MWFVFRGPMTVAGPFKTSADAHKHAAEMKRVSLAIGRELDRWSVHKIKNTDE